LCRKYWLSCLIFQVGDAVGQGGTYAPFVKHLNELGLIPVLVPRDQEVGNVYNPETLEFVYRRADCFPRLNVGEATSTILPSINKESDFEMSLAAGIPVAGNANISAKFDRVLSISFEDVKYQLATATDLRKAFDQISCPDLEAIVKGTKMPVNQGAKPLLIISEVYTGKRKVVLRTVQGADATVAASDLSKLLSKIGIPVNASAKVESNGESIVSLEATETLVIAVRPAFVSRKQQGITLGGSSSTSNFQETWVPYDPGFPTHRDAFGSVLDIIAENADKKNKFAK
jgi:hypothetical protein